MYTLAQLEALDEALAQGALQVQMGGRMVRYHSLADMLRLRDIIQAELGLANTLSQRRSRAWYPLTGKGGYG